MSKYRITPEGQLIVADLVRRGDVVTTSYSTGPYVVLQVSGPFTKSFGFEHPPCYSLSGCSVADFDNGKRQCDSYINELVAVDGRLLKLYEGNDDEVYRQPEHRNLQTSLFP